MRTALCLLVLAIVGCGGSSSSALRISGGVDIDLSPLNERGLTKDEERKLEEYKTELARKSEEAQQKREKEFKEEVDRQVKKEREEREAKE
jgi:hypothetical protein